MSDEIVKKSEHSEVLAEVVESVELQPTLNEGGAIASITAPRIGARYELQAEQALERKGYPRITDRRGEADYQGWESVVAQSVDGRFAVLSWTYGSCGGCDRFESGSFSDEQIVDQFCEEIDEFGSDEVAARSRFSASLGW